MSQRQLYVKKDGLWRPARPYLRSGGTWAQQRLLPKIDQTWVYGDEIVTDWKTPGTAVNTSRLGWTAWSNPGLARVDDGSVASAASLGSGEGTTRILFHSFGGFGIPADASVSKIELKLKRRMSAANQSIYDETFQLGNGTNPTSNILGNNAAGGSGGPFWDNSTSFETVILSGTAAQFGLVLSPSWLNLNSSGFGIWYACRRSTGGSSTDALIDAAQARVTYTPVYKLDFWDHGLATDFDGSSWTMSGATMRRMYDAWLLAEGASGSYHLGQFDYVDPSPTTNRDFTFTVDARRGPENNLDLCMALQLVTAGTDQCNVVWDLTTGAMRLTSSGGDLVTGFSYSSERLKDGWWRFRLHVNTNSNTDPDVRAHLYTAALSGATMSDVVIYGTGSKQAIRLRRPRLVKANEV